jgi:hypothetical protein
LGPARSQPAGAFDKTAAPVASHPRRLGRLDNDWATRYHGRTRGHRVDARTPVFTRSIHFNGRRFDLAVASERRALELDPNALAPRLALRHELLSRRDVPAAALVRLYAGSGDHEAFFAALERTIAERSDIIPRLKVSPIFDAERSDRRFEAVLNRLRLSSS